MAFPSLPSWSSRNPLSILALFIALIYGMAALLFGVAIKSLTTWNQTILVIFLVVFPVAVLCVFAWLVSKHHAKLYSPGEYRTDAAFHNAPLSFGGRFDDTAEAPAPPPADTSPSSAPDEPSSPPPRTSTPPAPPAPPRESPSAPIPIDAPVTRSGSDGHQSVMRQGLLAETLAFQELQREFDAAVRRDVSVTLNNRVYALDGIVEAEGQNYAVEVRFIRNHVSALKRARDIATRLQGLMMPVIFAFVVEDNLVNVDDVRRDAEKIARAYPNFIVRVWPVSELLTKYGLR
jgi:hypothetical protein